MLAFARQTYSSNMRRVRVFEVIRISAILDEIWRSGAESSLQIYVNRHVSQIDVRLKLVLRNGGVV
jgi:hypothetical protein